MEGIATAFIGLGSNLGDRLANLSKAVQLFRDNGDICALDLSSIRESQPVGHQHAPAAGGPYLNAVARVLTVLSPFDLLCLGLQIEESLGRIRSVRNAARTIDLDVLLYEDQVLRLPPSGDRPELILPHPRMLERGFVLEPLAELDPERVHPMTGRSFRDHWLSLKVREGGTGGDEGYKQH